MPNASTLTLASAEHDARVKRLGPVAVTSVAALSGVSQAITYVIVPALLIGPEPDDLLRMLANPTQPLFSVLIVGFAGAAVALRLYNTDQVTDYFELDDFGVHTPVLAGQDGLAVFTPTQPGTYLFYCAPHYDPKTGQGMHGTLVVE